MRSRRVSSVAGNSMEIKRNMKSLVILKDVNGMLACELMKSIWVKGNFD